MPAERRPHPSEAQDWWRNAACRGTDTSLFYHPEDERGIFRRRREREAKAICAGCPVRQPCLEWALTRPETHGIWGGLTAEERADRRHERDMT
jgi:WhiB family redox-sensing transcriptional regulator